MTVTTGRKDCAQCGKSFATSERDRRFYKRFEVPAPTFCPRCRMQRRLSYRNDRCLYQTQSARSGKKLFSMYDPAGGLVVYDAREWWSDDWDATDFARDFDFGRTFSEQFADLRQEVPRFNLFNRGAENCDYVNYAPHCKSCYLVFGSWYNDECLYGQTLNECENCVDSLFLDRSAFCYENIDCNSNYASAYCQKCNNASESYFCYDCHSVSHCIGCWNLRNKEYHVLNEPVSKDEFEEQKARFSSYAAVYEFREKFQQLVREKAVHKAYTGFNNQNVSGDLIFHSRNARFCFSAYRCEDVAYSCRVFEQKDSYDFEGGGKGELVYESMSNDFAFHSMCCTTCENLSDSHYCDICFNCRNCFGCVGLRHKQYYIFNKRYWKEEYEKLVPRIIEHMRKTAEWGEFFPVVDSPHAYNETMANEYFPLSKEEVEKEGYRWKDDTRSAKVQTIAIPDKIEDVSEDICKEILCCERCGKNFKIILPEYQYLKKMSLPIPRKCHNCRHRARMELRNPRNLWLRRCARCEEGIRTSFSPKREETVYCEKCYLEEVC